MTQENDFSLLRPFDLEAAKRGEAICWYDGDKCTFVAEGDDEGGHCIRRENETLVLVRKSALGMAPLAWVEGRPVYKGDVLWNTQGDRSAIYVVEFVDGWLRGTSSEPEVRHSQSTPNRLTWTPPKPKTKQVKLLAWLSSDRLHLMIEGTCIPAKWKRAPSEDKTIEVTE